MFRITLLLSFTCSVASADLWDQWRGPSRDGIIRSSESGKAWPQSFDSLDRAWHNELAHGYSSPIISDTHVFTVETKDKKQEIVRAFDRATGKQVWEHSWDGAMKVPFFAAKNGSWVRCTPAYDGEHLFVGGMRDVLVCLDAKTGEQVWRVDFVEREGSALPSFGFVSSPLIDGDNLYVQAGAAIMCLDKKTGEKKWESMKDDRAMYGSAFSSPVIEELQGKRQLVVQICSSSINKCSLLGE